MKIEEVKEYFGTPTQAAHAIQLPVDCIYLWTTRGAIPVLQQLRFERVSRGALIADDPNTNNYNYKGK